MNTTWLAVIGFHQPGWFGYSMLHKSAQNLNVGKECLENGQYDAAASRIYYAVFQAVLNWARAKKGFGERRDGVHGAIARLMNEGTSSYQYHIAFLKARRLREKADYDPDPVTMEELDKLLPSCESIIDFYKSKVE